MAKDPMNSTLPTPALWILRFLVYLPPVAFCVYLMARLLTAGSTTQVNPLHFLFNIGCVVVWTYIVWFAYPIKSEKWKVVVRIAIVATSVVSLILFLLMMLGPLMGGVTISLEDKAKIAVAVIVFAPAIDHGIRFVLPKRSKPPIT